MNIIQNRKALSSGFQDNAFALLYTESTGDIDYRCFNIVSSVAKKTFILNFPDLGLLTHQLQRCRLFESERRRNKFLHRHTLSFES